MMSSGMYTYLKVLYHFPIYNGLCVQFLISITFDTRCHVTQRSTGCKQPACARLQVEASAMSLSDITVMSGEGCQICVTGWGSMDVTPRSVRQEPMRSVGCLVFDDSQSIAFLSQGGIPRMSQWHLCASIPAPINWLPRSSRRIVGVPVSWLYPHDTL